MSLRLIYGSATPAGNSALAKWAAQFMPLVDETPDYPFGPCQCVAVAREGERDPLAVVVLHDWQPLYKTLQISMAARSPMWARPSIIGEILAIPFEKYGLRKVYTMIPSTSARVIKFNEHLGFRREAMLSEHFAPKVHAAVMGMKRRDYDAMIGRFADGQVQRAVAA